MKWPRRSSKVNASPTSIHDAYQMGYAEGHSHGASEKAFCHNTDIHPFPSSAPLATLCFDCVSTLSNGIKSRYPLRGGDESIESHYMRVIGWLNTPERKSL